MGNEKKVSCREATRRSVLAAAGIGTVTTLAGCMTDDNDVDEGTIRMLTATEGTAAYAANEGAAAVINDNTDEIFVEAQPSAGTEANIGSLMDGSAEMVYGHNWTINKIMEGEEPYNKLEFEPAQVVHFQSIPWFFVTADEDLESLSDIDSETLVSPTPEGSGTAPALEHGLKYATDEYERVSYSFMDQGSAMEEGRLDVTIANYINLDVEPGWQQEMTSTVDTYIMEVGDDVLSAWEDDPVLVSETFPADELGSFAGGADEVVALAFEYNFIARPDLDYDTVYEFLEVLYKHRNDLGRYHDILEWLEDEENLVEPLFDDVPLHAAAYDFWDEQGLLEDQYERADES